LPKNSSFPCTVNKLWSSTYQTLVTALFIFHFHFFNTQRIKRIKKNNSMISFGQDRDIRLRVIFFYHSSVKFRRAPTRILFRNRSGLQNTYLQFNNLWTILFVFLIVSNIDKCSCSTYVTIYIISKFKKWIMLFYIIPPNGFQT